MNRAVQGFSWLVRRPWVAIAMLATVIAGQLFVFHPHGPPPPRGPHGPPRGPAVITALAPQALSLQTEDGWTKSVVLDDKTVYRNGRDPASYNDLRVGMRVHVHDRRQDDGTWVAREVQIGPPPPPPRGAFLFLLLGLGGGLAAWRLRKRTPGPDPLPTAEA